MRLFASCNVLFAVILSLVFGHQLRLFHQAQHLPLSYLDALAEFEWTSDYYYRTGLHENKFYRRGSNLAKSPALRVRNDEPGLHKVKAAALAVASAMGAETYALVGGAACVMLGSNRQTADIDFVVPQGKTPDSRTKLRAKPNEFSIAPGTLHTSYKSTPPVEVEILAPPALFKEAFDANTPTINVDGIKVLHPVLLLNAKCGSLPLRSSDAKKYTDRQDIIFLLGYLRKNGIKPTPRQVPHANKAFVTAFIHFYGGENEWIGAGFNPHTGK